MARRVSHYAPRDTARARIRVAHNRAMELRLSVPKRPLGTYSDEDWAAHLENWLPRDPTKGYASKWAMAEAELAKLDTDYWKYEWLIGLAVADDAAREVVAPRKAVLSRSNGLGEGFLVLIAIVVTGTFLLTSQGTSGAVDQAKKQRMAACERINADRKVLRQADSRIPLLDCAKISQSR